MRLGFGKISASVTIAASLAITLGACMSNQSVAPVAPVAAPAIAPDLLVGKWGLASYHKEADRLRTETAARGQCNKPYVIGMGQSGGVLMHLADQPQAQEVFIKSTADGKTFLGPAGDAGGQLDREIVSFDNGVLVTRWVDPDSASRYGTMIFARCAPR